jgi:hypothetical protein
MLPEWHPRRAWTNPWENWKTMYYHRLTNVTRIYICNSYVLCIYKYRHMIRPKPCNSKTSIKLLAEPCWLAAQCRHQNVSHKWVYISASLRAYHHQKSTPPHHNPVCQWRTKKPVCSEHEHSLQYIPTLSVTFETWTFWFLNIMIHYDTYQFIQTCNNMQ